MQEDLAKSPKIQNRNLLSPVVTGKTQEIKTGTPTVVHFIIAKENTSNST